MIYAHVPKDLRYVWTQMNAIDSESVCIENILEIGTDSENR